jgi:hypothetical protein
MVVCFVVMNYILLSLFDMSKNIADKKPVREYKLINRVIIHTHSHRESITSIGEDA